MKYFPILLAFLLANTSFANMFDEDFEPECGPAIIDGKLVPEWKACYRKALVLREKRHCKALNKYEKLAQKGDEYSIERLIEIYSKEWCGVFPNDRKVLMWRKQLANMGKAKHQYELGEYYAYSDSDWSEAFNWFEKAAKQGHVESQDELMMMYYFGKGVLKNHIKAYIWAVVIERGDHNLEVLRSAVTFRKNELQLSKRQRSKAQELSEACYKSHNYESCDPWLAW
jgi:hypothetical protein